MSADVLIGALDDVRKTGVGKWRAICPAHGSKNKQALVISETDDGRVLLHCFAGCAVHEVLAACNVDMAELFPPQEIKGAKPVKRPYNSIDVLRSVAFESVVVLLIANAVKNGEKLTDARYERLVTATERISDASRIASGG